MWKYRSTRDTAWVARAERQSHRALAITDRLASGRVTLGKLYHLTGNHEAAVGQFSIAIELDSMDAEAHFGLAAAYRALQRIDEAERAYRQTISLQPANWQPHNDLGNLYILTGHYDEAIKHFQRAVALAPSEARPYEGMAGAHLYQESLDEARVWAQRALNIRPSYVAYSYLGDASYLAEDYEAAARSYERALQINDTDYLVWGNLADVYGLLPGRDAEAKAAYQRAIRGAEEWRSISPSDPEILSDLAAYRAKLGQDEEAVAMLDAVDMGVSADMYLAERVATLYAQLGHEQDAIKWIEEAIRRGHSVAELEAKPTLRNLLPQLEHDAVP
jgi:serine/threonine-protein kinase